MTEPISDKTASAAGIPSPGPVDASNAVGSSSPTNDPANWGGGQRPPMPPAVAKAVSSVMGGVTKLKKSEHNNHGNYDFASVDDFLEAIRPLCAKAGLIISQDEESQELKQTTKADGKPATWLKMTFSYTLIHSSGETWGHRPTRTVMVNAGMGAQAFGAAQSYGLKQFMRSLFQVATGEPDLDADNADEIDRRPPSREQQEDRMAERVVKHTLRKDIATPAGAKVFALIDQFGDEVYQTENVDDYAERLSALLEKMPNPGELKQLWENNESQVKPLPDSRAADVTAVYEGRSSELAEELPQTALEAG